MITAEEVKVLDKNSEYYGVSTLSLMERAGKGVAEFILEKVPKNKSILVVCGPGNNGGDGFVAARYLAPKYKVSVYVVGDIKSDIARSNFEKLKDVKIKTNSFDTLLSESDVIIDSMLGTGLSGILREPFSSIVKKIRECKKMVVSVDVPTGLGTNLALKPDYTITFHDLKEGMNPDNSGEIKVVDIGIPKEAKEYVGPGELVYYPKPKKDSHKGENGIVLVIGGGPYVGAPTLSGMAALRIGVDLVFIATPKRCWQQISSFSPNLIVKELSSDILKEEDIPLLEGLIDKCTAIIVGPGLGNSEETEEAVKGVMELLAKKRKPLVIDADAIKPVGEELDTIRNSKTVITPHRNEFKKLTGLELSNNMEESVATVSGWAREMGVTLFLKGPIDIISDGKETKLNKIHNEAMTVGGTGDVLSGIIGGLLSKGVKPFNAARMAAFINGEAGNESFRKKSYGLLATDIVEEIPEVLKKYL